MHVDGALKIVPPKNAQRGKFASKKGFGAGERCEMVTISGGALNSATVRLDNPTASTLRTAAVTRQAAHFQGHSFFPNYLVSLLLIFMQYFNTQVYFLYDYGCFLLSTEAQ